MASKDVIKVTTCFNTLVSLWTIFYQSEATSSIQTALKLQGASSALPLLLTAFTIHLQHYALHGHFLGGFKKLNTLPAAIWSTIYMEN